MIFEVVFLWDLASWVQQTHTHPPTRTRGHTHRHARTGRGRGTGTGTRACTRAHCTSSTKCYTLHTLLCFVETGNCWRVGARFGIVAFENGPKHNYSSHMPLLWFVNAALAAIAVPLFLESQWFGKTIQNNQSHPVSCDCLADACRCSMWPVQTNYTFVAEFTDRVSPVGHAYDISLAFGGTNVHSRRWRWRPQTRSSEPLRCTMEWRGVLN